MGQFKKGNDPRRNTAGRPKGAKDRTTAELREALREFVDQNIDKLQTSFDNLDDEKKLSFFEKIIKMVLPPPVNPDQLTESQMIELINYLRKEKK